uniref:LacI family DNA-binding transcriptional regulator n=1 Tax=Muricomes intestini TaxID=1796634 RepID=UPI002FE1E2D3
MPDKKIEKRNKGSSIKDVAELAGVSVGTVSHALNSRGYVKKETKEKIVRAAAELNYIPNRAGRILKTNETKLIMLAIPDTSNEIYFGMIEEVQKN